MGNIIYKVVRREIANKRLVRDSLGGILVEEKVVESILHFSHFFNGDSICDVCHVRILQYYEELMEY